MRASELLLIVRAQNQASAALRRVAADMKGLSRVGGLQRRGEQLNINRQNLMAQRQRLQGEIQSIENGKRMYQQQRLSAAAELASQKRAYTASTINRDALLNSKRMLDNQNKLEKLSRIGGARAGANTQLGRSFKAASIEAQVLSDELGRLDARRNMDAAATEKQVIAMKELDAAQAREMATLGAKKAQLATVGSRLAMNTADIRENNKAISAARWDRWAAGGRIMQHTARIMEYGGLVLGGTLAVVAHQAANFETMVTLAATQTRKVGHSFTETAGNAKVLQRDIRGLMTEFPAQAEDFSKAAYDIYSSTNVGFGRGRKLLKLFAQAAVAGMTDVQTATSAGITVLNNFQKESSSMPKLMQIMFAAVRFGRMTFKDFADSMATLAPAARAANQTFTSMAGSFAFLTRHLGVAKARVGYARVLEALTTPKMLTGLKKVGIEVQDAQHHMLPLEDIMGKIVKRFPQLQRGGTDAMNFFKNIGGATSTIMARRAFTFLVQFYNKAGKDGASYREMLRQVAGDHKEFTRSLQAMEKTTGVRWGVFVNQLKALALAIGTDVIPVLLQLSGPIQKVVKWWESLSDSTRRAAARFAAFSAAFLLVGGAVMFLAGSFMNIFATLGKFIGLGGTMVATLFLIATAVTALSGDLHGLSDILNTIVDFSFGSFQGFAISLGIAAVAAVRLTGALRGLAAAEVTMGKGGILASLLGAGRGARSGAAIGRASGAGLRGMLLGAAGGAGLLSTSLLPVVGIVAAIGVGMLAWKRHMDAVRKAAAAVRADIAIGAGPRRALDVFQGLPGGIESVERAKIGIRSIKREITDLRKQMSGARGARRFEILDQIRSATMDLADAQNVYSNAVAKSNRQFDALTLSFAKFGTAGKRVVDLRNQINDLVRAQQKAGESAGKVMYGRPLEQLRAQLRGVQGEMVNTARNLEGVFGGVIKQITRIEGIKLPRGALQDMFKSALKMGRMLTVPEIRAIVKAEIDPDARRRLPGEIGRIFRGVRAQRIKVEIDEAQARKATANVKKAQQAVPKALRFPAFSFPDPKAAAKRAHSSAAKAFTPIKQKIIVTPPPHGTLVQMGVDITQGIQSGIDAVDVTIVKHMTTITREIQAKSPSKWAIEKVGKPIGQGIAIGILQSAGLLEKAATASISFFESAAIQKAQEAKKKITDALLIKDIGLQASTLAKFNRSIARLGRRGVPRELIDQLAALGPESVKLITQISRMSRSELAKYVAMWRRANQSVKNSFRSTYDDMKAAAKQFHDDLKSKLMDMYTSLRETTAGQFGELFAGIDPATYGEGLKQAQTEYANQISDFQNQIGDLNNQLVDAQKEASQRLVDAIAQRKDELQQAFGQLFSGDWLTGTEVQTKLDWGAKLGFEDLQKDLESQVNKFARWRDDLTSLAGKVPPELAKQLEALGPEAVDKLDVLNNATGDQLQQYVATWQNGQNQMQAIANQTTVDTSDITARMADLVKQIDDVTTKMSQLQYPHALTGEDLITDLQKQMDQWTQYNDLLQDLIDKGLPPELIEQLRAMGPQAMPYLQALNTMTAEQLEKYKIMWKEKEDAITKDTLTHLNAQLRLWYDYGAGIGANLVAGISSQANQLQAYFEDLIMSFLKKKNIPVLQMGGIVNRPGLFQLGEAGPEAVIPLDPWLKNLLAGGPSGNAPTGASGGNVGPTTVVNMTVNAHQDESLSTTLNTAAFRLNTAVPG